MDKVIAQREYYWRDNLGDSSEKDLADHGTLRLKDDANLVSSRVAGLNKQNMPILDLDFDCKLVESSTRGHYHLYLNKVISWDQYKPILTALHNAGLINTFWYESSLASKGTFVRPEGVYK